MKVLNLGLLIALLASPALVSAQNPAFLSWLSAVFNALGANFFDETFANNGAALPVNNLILPEPVNPPYYVLYAYAVSCNVTLENWTCNQCQMIGNNTRFDSSFINPNYNTKAFIGIDDTRKEIVLSFQGTANVQNGLTDLTFVPISLGDSSGIRVASGFYAATKSLYTQVLARLITLTGSNPDHKVVITGTSLGGAMASLTTFLLKYQTALPSTVLELYTYGEPRQGNKAYATYFDALPIVAARVVNQNDVVPHLGYPAFLGYFHHQKELWLRDQAGPNTLTTVCSGAVYEDPACSNSQGPLYSPLPHITYYGYNAFECAGEEPLNAALQLVLPLKSYIPAQLFMQLQTLFPSLGK